MTSRQIYLAYLWERYKEYATKGQKKFMNTLDWASLSTAQARVVESIMEEVIQRYENEPEYEDVYGM